MDSLQYAEFFTEFMDESERAAVVLGAAQIEELLADILKIRLLDANKKLFDGNGPLSSFSSRISFAHAVGVIDKDFASRIHIFRDIRNEYVHNIKGVDYSSQSVKDKIDHLASEFSKSKFWQPNLDAAGRLYKLEGHDLILRFAITLIVANLSLIKANVKPIDQGEMKPMFFSRE